ncbi:MAG TPA: hypothetical protein VFX52_01435 [Nocardioidaceae bacterium]|nr:hypothetical protein [Nocardioidaceae bacterium]
MARDEEDAPWTRQLLVSAVVLVVVALVVGGVAGLVALGAARVSGIGQSGSGSSAKPSLYLPSHEPTTKPLRSSAAIGSGSATPSRTGSAGQQADKKKADKKKADKKKVPVISLDASPGKVSAGQRIDLTGTYPGGDGTRLQVQRLEGGTWTDFPVDATVHGRRFATYVLTGRTGVNRFRMLDTTTGRHSDPVRVTVG